MSFLTIVIPTHNEERNILLVFRALQELMETVSEIEWDILFVDDGSTDGTMDAMVGLAEQESRVKYVELSRNFGKEIATTAGLHAALDAYQRRADKIIGSVISFPYVTPIRRHVTDFAVILMDADLQHPPKYIPIFIEQWRRGADMVVGVRSKNHGEGWIKKIGSCAFNKIMKLISEREYTPRSTDFRLISKPVLIAFAEFTERGRMTRGLLDWLGFKKVDVEFEADERMHGTASYNYIKLIKLAISSFLSHSLFPLKLAGYLGVIISIVSIPLLIFMMFERYVLLDPWDMNFSGPAILAILNLSLIGIVLGCLGLVALYIGTIHTEAMNRPLYVVKGKKI